MREWMLIIMSCCKIGRIDHGLGHGRFFQRDNLSIDALNCQLLTGERQSAPLVLHIIRQLTLTEFMGGMAWYGQSGVTVMPSPGTIVRSPESVQAVALRLRLVIDQNGPVGWLQAVRSRPDAPVPCWGGWAEIFVKVC